MKTSTYNVRVNIHPEQQQGNGVDFGLFAIVFAVIWEFGDKSETISCDEGYLQRHLVDCLKLKKFSPFSEYKNNKRVNEPGDVIFN